MKYKITQTETGVVFGVYAASSEEEALDAYARDAGYSSFNSIPEEIGGAETLEVEEVSDGEAIRCAKEREGLTTAQLAARLGVSQSTVTSWICDARRPSVDSASRILAVLGVSVLARSPRRPTESHIIIINKDFDLSSVWRDDDLGVLDSETAELIECLGYEPDPDADHWGLASGEGETDAVVGWIYGHRTVLEDCDGLLRAAVACPDKNISSLLSLLNGGA